MKNDIIQYLRNKSILILGYGKEGQTALRFVLENLPNNRIAVADLNPIDLSNARRLNGEALNTENVETFSGEDYLKHCENYDLIIKSPGVVIKNLVNDEIKEKITSLSDLFLCFCQNYIIGVTGTKGKSTTSSLIYHILKSCGRDAVLTGNIGQPCFEVIDQLEYETVVVFELSAHQLEFVKASPHIAILLNLYEEHLDHYNTAEDYWRAKKNIARFQTRDDFFIYGDISQHMAPEEFNLIDAQTQSIYDINIPDEAIHTNLVGEHNFNDIRAAVYACELVGIPREAALNAVESFHGLPHRMEFVGEFKGIKFYNDSIATAQEATINAIKALSDVNTVILGGMDRGLNYEKLVNFLRNSDVRNVILLPNTERRFMSLFNSASYKQRLFVVRDMTEAVKTAFRETEPGKICLLSPAAASYGFYKNFEKRGEDYVGKIKEFALE